MTDFPTLLYTSTCDIPTLWYTWRLKKVPLSGGDPPLPPPPLGSLCRLYFACSEDYTSHIAIFRDGPLEKWWGVGNFRSLLVQEFFFAGENLCTNFFSDKYCFSFEQWNLDSLSMFLYFTNYYSTLTPDQRIQATFKRKIFSKMYTQWERRNPLGVDGFPVHCCSPFPLEFLSHRPS